MARRISSRAGVCAPITVERRRKAGMIRMYSLPLQTQAHAETTRAGGIEILLAAGAGKHADAAERSNVRFRIVVVRGVQEIRGGHLPAHAPALSNDKSLGKTNIHDGRARTLDYAFRRAA